MGHADLCDIAAEAEQISREDAIAKALAKKGASLRPKGRCHYCWEQVGRGKLFCDQGCAEEYDYEQARKAANAKVIW